MTKKEVNNQIYIQTPQAFIDIGSPCLWERGQQKNRKTIWSSGADVSKSSHWFGHRTNHDAGTCYNTWAFQL
jgi:hypothetical protein